MMITMMIFMKGDWSGERRPPASAPLAPIPPSRKACHCYQVAKKCNFLKQKKKLCLSQKRYNFLKNDTTDFLTNFDVFRLFWERCLNGFLPNFFLKSFNNKVCSKSNLPPQIEFANLSLRLCWVEMGSWIEICKLENGEICTFWNFQPWNADSVQRC